MTWARPSIFRSSVTGDGGQFCQAMGVAARKAEGGERLTRRCNLNLKVRWNVGNWRAPLSRRQRVFVLRFRRLPWTPSVATPRRAWGSYFFGGPARQPSPSMAASAAHAQTFDPDAPLAYQAADARRGPPDGGELRQAAGVGARKGRACWIATILFSFSEAHTFSLPNTSHVPPIRPGSP